MKMIEELLTNANDLGACGKTAGIDSLDKLVALYESPQGREFCAKHNFPTREQWIRIGQHWGNQELTRHNIYIDSRNAHILERNPENIVLVGASTKAQVILAGADKKHTIFALHGATVDLIATDYAVFEVVTDGLAHISINKDNTSIQL